MPRLTMGAEGPAMIFDDPPTDCQAHARARIVFSIVQSLKHLKNTIQVFWVEANTVVGYVDLVVERDNGGRPNIVG